jgi:hypothetical protein
VLGWGIVVHELDGELSMGIVIAQWDRVHLRLGPEIARWGWETGAATRWLDDLATQGRVPRTHGNGYPSTTYARASDVIPHLPVPPGGSRPDHYAASRAWDSEIDWPSVEALDPDAWQHVELWDLS